MIIFLSGVQVCTYVKYIAVIKVWQTSIFIYCNGLFFLLIYFLILESRQFCVLQV